MPTFNGKTPISIFTGCKPKVINFKGIFDLKFILIAHRVSHSGADTSMLWNEHKRGPRRAQFHNVFIHRFPMPYLNLRREEFMDFLTILVIRNAFLHIETAPMFSKWPSSLGHLLKHPHLDTLYSKICSLRCTDWDDIREWDVWVIWAGVGSW